MSKTAVIFWTSTGNTEIMADAIIEGLNIIGAEGIKISASQFNINTVSEFDSFAFGCPAMGDEQLDEYEFEPLFKSLLPLLNGKKVLLFGSYGWGDGEWMRKWEETCTNNGIVPVQTIIANYAPDESVIELLKEASKALVS